MELNIFVFSTSEVSFILYIVYTWLNKVPLLELIFPAVLKISQWNTPLYIGDQKDEFDKTTHLV